MNFNHSEIVYLFERSRSVLDSTNYLIVSLSSEYRGLFASCGGWGEGKMEARGERWEGEASRLFPLSIVHLALSIFKSLPFLMDTQREPLQRSELQYSFLLFFLLVEIDKKYCLPIDLVVFSFFFKHMLLRYFSWKGGGGGGEKRERQPYPLSPIHLPFAIAVRAKRYCIVLHILALAFWNNFLLFLLQENTR